MKVSEKVSLGGEGGEGEADEGDAAEVGGGQGEQAKKQLHCSHLLWSNLCFQPRNWAGLCSFSDSFESLLCFGQNFRLWSEPPDFLVLLLLSHVFSLMLFDE